MAKIKVIDVSEHNGRIDWAAIKPHIGAAILRLGYGDNTTAQDDAQWARNVQECERLGIPWGAYLYSYATSTAHIDSEIAHALRLLKGHKPAYPVYFDTEEPGTGQFARAYAKRFCAAMEKAGYTAGIYASESWYNSYMPGLTLYTLWIAKYSAYSPHVGANYDAWQFTSAASMPGCASSLDVSWYYRDFSKDKTPASTGKTSTPVFRISTDPNGKKWEAVGKTGIKGKAIRWLAIKGVGKYRVKVKGTGWLPWVAGYNVSDLNSGCAGNGAPIVAVEIVSASWRYAVRALNAKSYYPEMIGTHDTGGSNDHYAGDGKTAIDGFTIKSAK